MGSWQETASFKIFGEESNKPNAWSDPVFGSYRGSLQCWFEATAWQESPPGQSVGTKPLVLAV